MELKEGPMDAITVVATLVFICLAGGFGVLFARLTSRDRLTVPPEEWEGIFSPSRYKAMERLLDETDRQFLSSYPKFNSGGEKKFRAVRVKIFRGYMQQLSEDFGRICKAVKVLMVHSQVDRPDLAGVLLKQQFTFSIAMMQVEVKLILYSAGWAGVDVKALLEPLANVRSQLQSLAAIADPSLGLSQA
jgi:hypothetical protein